MSNNCLDGNSVITLNVYFIKMCQKVNMWSIQEGLPGKTFTTICVFLNVFFIDSINMFVIVQSISIFSYGHPICMIVKLLVE